MLGHFIGTQNDHKNIFHFISDALLAQRDLISNELQFFHLPESRFGAHRKSVCIIKARLDGARNDTFPIWTKRKIYLMYMTICRYPKGHKMYLNDKIIQIGLVILVQFLLVGWSLTDWLTD